MEPYLLLCSFPYFAALTVPVSFVVLHVSKYKYKLRWSRFPYLLCAHCCSLFFSLFTTGSLPNAVITATLFIMMCDHGFPVITVSLFFCCFTAILPFTMTVAFLSCCRWFTATLSFDETTASLFDFVRCRKNCHCCNFFLWWSRLSFFVFAVIFCGDLRWSWLFWLSVLPSLLRSS